MQSMEVCQRRKKKKSGVLLLVLSHTLHSQGHVIQSHSCLLFKQEIMHFFPHRGEDSLPAEVPCPATFTRHGVENKLHFFLNGGRGFFRLIFTAVSSLLSSIRKGFET